MAPIFIQPPQQTIVMAPAPGPQIVFASAPPSQPSYGAAPPAQPAPNVFMAPAPQPTYAMAPPAQPTYAMAPQAQQVMMAPQAQQVMMAPQAQQVMMAPAVGQSPLAAAAITVIAPRLLDRMIGALGEHMAEKKHPRVRLSEAPTSFALSPAPMQSYAPAPAGYAPAPAGYALMPVGPAFGQGHGGHGQFAPPCPAPSVGQSCGNGHCHSCGASPYYAPPAQNPSPNYPAPSPQVEPPHKSFFKR